MGFSLDSMFDKISAYKKIQEDFGFRSAGTGDRAWSIKYVSEEGLVLTVRNSDWVLLQPSGEMIAEGTSPTELKALLLGRMSYKELIEFATRT